LKVSANVKIENLGQMPQMPPPWLRACIEVKITPTVMLIEKNNFVFSSIITANIQKVLKWDQIHTLILGPNTHTVYNQQLVGGLPPYSYFPQFITICFARLAGSWSR